MVNGTLPHETMDTDKRLGNRQLVTRIVSDQTSDTSSLDVLRNAPVV